MLVTASHLLIVIVAHLADARGPHHPRSEPVAKHTHYRPTKAQPEKLMQDTDLLHDTEHIQEHLEHLPDFTKMSPEEVEFYYFQVHDTDKNSKLDGLEILQAIMDTVHKEEGEENDADVNDLEYFIELIDNVLKEDDADNDGYLSYAEYASGRQKALIAERAQQPSVKMIS